MKSTKEIVAENILRDRTARDWSQSDLANAAHLSVRMIQKVESLESDPSTGTLDKLALGLGRSVEYLITDQSVSRSVKPTQQAPRDDEKLELLGIILDLPDTEVTVLLNSYRNRLRRSTVKRNKGQDNAGS